MSSQLQFLNVYPILCFGRAEEPESTDFILLPLLMEECSPVIPHHLLGLTDVKGLSGWHHCDRSSYVCPAVAGNQADNCCDVDELQGDAAEVCVLVHVRRFQRTRFKRNLRPYFT